MQYHGAGLRLFVDNQDLEADIQSLQHLASSLAREDSQTAALGIEETRAGSDETKTEDASTSTKSEEKAMEAWVQSSHELHADNKFDKDADNAGAVVEN